MRRLSWPRECVKSVVQLRICRMIHTTKNALKKNGVIYPEGVMNKFIVDTVDPPTICRALNTSGDSGPVGKEPSEI